MDSRVGIAGRELRRGAAQAEPRRGLELLGRAGLLARGLLYIIVGVLAFDVAQGETGEKANQKGAVQVVADQSFGTVLLILLAVGVAGYALWRATQAVIGRTIETGERQEPSKRVAAAAGAVAYGGIFVMIMGILFGSGGGGSGGLDRMTRWAMDISPWLVGLAGAVVVGVALYQAYQGIARKFMDEMKTGQMSATARRWVPRVGAVGYCARAAAFALVGYGVIRAAWTYDPKDAQGLDGSLQRLLGQDYGGLLVGAVAVGLIAFGAYSLVEARHRRV